MVRHLEDVLHVVADEQHRHASLGHRPHELEHLHRLADAERGGGLVQHHDVAPHVIARPTAIIWRWPPESAETGAARLDREAEGLQVVGGLAIHGRRLSSAERPPERVAIEGLAVEEEILRHVQRVHERRFW